MNIQSLLMARLGTDSEQQAGKSNSQRTDSFGSLMEKMSASSDTKTVERYSNGRREEAQRNENSSNNRANKSRSEDRRDQVRGDGSERRTESDKPRNTDRSSKTDSASSTEEKAVKQTDRASNSASEEVDTEAIDKLSGILGIEAEKIMEILNTLNMSVQDLADGGKLNEFLQMAFGANSSIDLLSVANIKDIISQIKDFLDQSMAKTDLQNGDITELDLDGENIKDILSDSAEEDVDVPDPSKLKSVADEPTEDARAVETEKPAQNTQQTITSPLQQGAVGQADYKHQSDNFQDNEDGNWNHTTSGVVSTSTRENVQYGQTVLRNQANRNINTQDVINQLLEKIKIDYKGDATEIKMILKPENLGEVTLKVVTESGIITAQFIAENQRIKEIIESQFNQLKDALQQQGIEVSSLQVSVGQDQQDQRMNEFLREQQKSARRIQKIISDLTVEEEVTEVTLEPDSSVEYKA